MRWLAALAPVRAGGEGNVMGIKPEERLHLDVAKFLRVALKPPVFWTSVDHGSGKLSRRAAGMAKARGVRAGLPDIMIFAPCEMAAACKVIGIELKSAKGTLSPAQVETHGDMMVAAVRCRTARSIEHVQDILIANGIPLHARIS